MGASLTAAGKGRALELAVKHAAAVYEQQDRATLRRQVTPMATGTDGYVQFTERAPVDFLGSTGPRNAHYVAGRALAIECKETKGRAFALAKLREEQRDALGIYERMGAIALLIVDFVDWNEVYSVTWPRVAEFLRAPWRHSLSLDWFRAFGLVLPEENRGKPRRCTYFLDGKDHWARLNAQTSIDAERAACPTISLEDKEDPSPSPHAAEPPLYSNLTVEQIRARIIAATTAGLDRQLRASSRKARWRKDNRR